MAAFKGKLDFKINYLPFELDPTLPKQGVDKLTMYREKFGADRVEQMIPRMQAMGQQIGIEFTYSGKVAKYIHFI